MNNLINSDAEAAAVAVTKRITLDDILAEIVSEEYLVRGTTTLALLTLACGFLVVGQSACMYPANFNAELGEKFAKEDALREVWKLEVYAWKKKKNAV